MAKTNINFKQIRKRVIHSDQNHDPSNQPINPLHKISFRGIRQHRDTTLQQTTKLNVRVTHFESKSPTKLSSVNKRAMETSRDQCKKFTILLGSKGYNSCGSERKKSIEGSFKNLSAAAMSQFHNIRTNTQKSREEQSNEEAVNRKCREIKSKNYLSFRPNLGELSSLSKLKNKLISPIKTRHSAKQPQDEPARNTLQQSSILSEHDLVNMSKNNDDSIRFDMSPFM